MDADRIKTIEGYLEEKKSLEERKESLMENLRSLEEVISTYEKAAAEKSYDGEEIQEELTKSRILAGAIDVEGPGVEIVLNDRKRESILTKDPGYAELLYRT